MEFFDIRQVLTGHVKDLVATTDDYWVVVFLPLIVICAVILGICIVCKYKKWKHEQKQIAYLNDFYDIYEDSAIYRHGKLITLEHSKVNEDHIRRSMLLPPTEASPFFQPSKKTRSMRFDVPQKATSASEVIFHFTNLNAETRKISLDEQSESEIEHIV